MRAPDLPGDRVVMEKEELRVTVCLPETELHQEGETVLPARGLGLSWVESSRLTVGFMDTCRGGAPASGCGVWGKHS